MTNKAVSSETKNGKSTYLTTAEACQRLQMTTRNFRLLRKRLGPVEGQTIIGGSLLFPVESLDAWYARYEGSSPEEEDETIEDAAAASLREFANGVRLVLAVALEAIKFTLGADQNLVKLSFEQAENAGKALQQSQQHSLAQQKHSLDAVMLVKDLIIETGKLEADRLKAEGDQSVRVERTKLAAKGIRQLAPLAKAGIARWLGAPAISREAQAEAIGELVRSLKDNPEKLVALQEKLTERQREAVGLLLSYAEGSEKLPEALKMLKDDMDDAQREELQKLLDDKQLMAIAQLFEEIEDEPAPQQNGIAQNGAASGNA